MDPQEIFDDGVSNQDRTLEDRSASLSSHRVRKFAGSAWLPRVIGSLNLLMHAKPTTLAMSPPRVIVFVSWLTAGNGRPSFLKAAVYGSGATGLQLFRLPVER